MNARTTLFPVFLLVLYIGIAYAPVPAHAEGSAVPFEDRQEEDHSERREASNVLFLPGIKGSRLYDDQGQKLWEPFGNHDVEYLMLDEQGLGINPDVQTNPGDIIDSVAGLNDIYGSFVDSMDALKEEGTIMDWHAYAYDWRLSLPAIVFARQGPVPVSDWRTPYLQQALEALAETSKTGKVTIVAHSNGGLVTKYLLHALGDTESQRLIDKVILVGVPQSGAPQALAALLYGYKEGLPWWFPGIVSTATARQFAENAPMGYHLLPSDAYFETVQESYLPVVAFGPGDSHAEERDAYGVSIDSFPELTNFARAEEGGRTKPDPRAIWHANVLNGELLDYARDTHDRIDGWTPPPGIPVYQIGGWGEDTVAGIEYYERCVLDVCASLYRPTFTEDGDGVVPVSSALMMPETDTVKRYWLDLYAYNDRSPFDKDHGTLLSLGALRSLIVSMLTSDEPLLPDYVQKSQPSPDREQRSLRFFLHSPLTLEIYDEHGRRSGPDGNGGEEESIPGSRYGTFGDVQYLTVPAGPEYRIELHGFDSGTFTFEIQESESGDVIDEIAFVELPTDERTKAVLTVGSTLDSADPLMVDTDGDGTTDLIVPSRTEHIDEESTFNKQGLAKKRQKAVKDQTPENVTVEGLSLQLYVLLLRLLVLELEKEPIV